MTLTGQALIILFAPLLSALLAGLNGKRQGPVVTHRLAVGCLSISASMALLMCYQVLTAAKSFNQSLYSWVHSGAIDIGFGLLIDPLSAMMTVTVTFVSLFVHIYSIGYMDKDPGYQRFFSYVSLFTFAMLNLILANNLVQLFFGWEGVGLVSYLLIGFWFDREAAVQGSLKAFIVNRVGDFGLILALAMLFLWCGSLDYSVIFASLVRLVEHHIVLFGGWQIRVVGFVCFFLFVGAMGKSAQVPLHVWLPESMEGPTPISALIHAATMVTAGIYLIARFSPLFEQVPAVLNWILIVGATGALFLGLVGLVQNDIKRVVAYSTLSQLGYMVAAAGASAYSIAIFHLLTHAFFKALLFLAAGSVIHSVHHEQDMRHMGNLWRYMPITTICFILGSLSLCAVPFLSGFYSKDAIITAVGLSTLPAGHYAYVCLVLGSFVTTLYSFRAIFMTFFGIERLKHKPVHESPWTITLPLIVLAVPSVVLGYLMVGPLFNHASLGGAITVGQHGQLVIETLREEFAHPFQAGLHAVMTTPFWMVLFGLVVSWVTILARPELSGWFVQRFALFYHVLVDKYGFDRFNDRFWVQGTRKIAEQLFTIGDQGLIERGIIASVMRFFVQLSTRLRAVQSGYLYHYVTMMILGLAFFAFIVWGQLTSGSIVHLGVNL